MRHSCVPHLVVLLGKRATRAPACQALANLCYKSSTHAQCIASEPHSIDALVRIIEQNLAIDRKATYDEARWACHALVNLSEDGDVSRMIAANCRARIAVVELLAFGAYGCKTKAVRVVDNLCWYDSTLLPYFRQMFTELPSVSSRAREALHWLSEGHDSSAAWISNRVQKKVFGPSDAALCQITECSMSLPPVSKWCGSSDSSTAASDAPGDELFESSWPELRRDTPSPQ